MDLLRVKIFHMQYATRGAIRRAEFCGVPTSSTRSSQKCFAMYLPTYPASSFLGGFGKDGGLVVLGFGWTVPHDEGFEPRVCSPVLARDSQSIRELEASRYQLR